MQVRMCVFACLDASDHVCVCACMCGWLIGIWDCMNFHYQGWQGNGPVFNWWGSACDTRSLADNMSIICGTVETAGCAWDVHTLTHTDTHVKEGRIGGEIKGSRKGEVSRLWTYPRLIYQPSIPEVIWELTRQSHLLEKQREVLKAALSLSSWSLYEV